MYIPLCLFCIFLIAQLSLFGLSQTCYWPDNSVAENLTPCNSAAINSHCCGPYALCLDNGYAVSRVSKGVSATDCLVTASTKVMNTAIEYLVAGVQTRRGTAMPVQNTAKHVSSGNRSVSQVWMR